MSKILTTSELRAEYERLVAIRYKAKGNTRSLDSQISKIEKEIIARYDRRIQTVLPLEKLEEIYMDGCADEVSGDQDFITGHFYRVGSQIVTTDSQGFRSVETFLSIPLAERDFRSRAEEYAKKLCDG